MAAPKDEPADKTTKWDLARRGAAGLILLAMTGFVVATYVPGGLRICREQLTTAGAVVQLCRPAGTDDIIAIGLLLLLALVLLAPDLSEFGVGGLLNVKLYRRVAAIERQADSAATDVALLSLAAAAPTSDSITDASASAASKARSGDISTRHIERTISLGREKAEQEFRALIAELDLYLRMLSVGTVNPERPAQELARREGVPMPRARYLLQLLRDWQSRFDGELTEYAKVRNTFVHYPERLSDDELRAGIGLAQRLRAAARHDLDWAVGQASS
jgi:hypothetical protein